MLQVAKDWDLSYDLSRMPSDIRGNAPAVTSLLAQKASECENSSLVVFLSVHGSCARAGFGLTVVTPTRASHLAHGCAQICEKDFRWLLL